MSPHKPFTNMQSPPLYHHAMCAFPQWMLLVARSSCLITLSVCRTKESSWLCSNLAAFTTKPPLSWGWQTAHDVGFHPIRDVNARNIGRKTRATKGRRFYWPTACAVRHRHYRTPLSLEPRSQQTRQTPVRTFHEQTQSSRTAHQETQKLPLVLRSNRPTPLIQATLRVP
jgi:hypothetical protein